MIFRLTLLVALLLTGSANAAVYPSFKSFNTNDFIITGSGNNTVISLDTNRFPSSSTTIINNSFVTNLFATYEYVTNFYSTYITVSNIVAGNIQGTVSYLAMFTPDSFSAGNSIVSQNSTNSVTINGTGTGYVVFGPYTNILSTDGTNPTWNGVPIGGVGGGSQTPWASDIDAASFSLNNLNVLSGIVSGNGYSITPSSGVGTPSTLLSTDALYLSLNGAGPQFSFGENQFKPLSDEVANLGATDHRWSTSYVEANFWANNSSYDSGFGSDPEGVISAGPGSIWRNTTSGDVWRKASGAGNTGWTLMSGGSTTTSAIASGSAGGISSNTGTNVTSISLTTGTWLVSGNVNFAATTATVTGASAGITTTSATVPTDGTEVYSGVQVTLLSENDSVTLPTKVITLGSPTTVYLVGKCTFSAGTVKAFGSISATRIN